MGTLIERKMARGCELGRFGRNWSRVDRGLGVLLPWLMMLCRMPARGKMGWLLHDMRKKMNSLVCGGRTTGRVEKLKNDESAKYDTYCTVQGYTVW